ncbi:MAG: hypothetical protein JXB35_11740, partial [Anaerolineae bacterium]|nr:hypothetical protein [Anaerolineae bacterium]
MRKCVGCRIFVFLVVVAGAGWLPGTAPIRTAASAPPEFDIAVIPAAQAVAPGEAITYTVALTATSGFSE